MIEMTPLTLLLLIVFILIAWLTLGAGMILRQDCTRLAGVIFTGVGVFMTLLLIAADVWLLGIIFWIVRGWMQ